MASAGGLSRRRVPQATGDDSGLNGSSTSGPSTNGATTPTSAVPRSVQHAGTAMEGGNKVAYDPRDLETESEGRRMPRLTILEEILLLGLNDKQGYLSFWNDNISYALRGCILIELALRRRIAVVKDASRRRFSLPDRLIEVVDERQTGETILDEALKMIKSNPEKMGVGSWVDLLSGETWNVLKIGYQLKQVRERLAKGLVDKGVLRTEKRNFLLFDMATHPVADATTKSALIARVRALLTCRTSSIPPEAFAVQPERASHAYTGTTAVSSARPSARATSPAPAAAPDEGEVDFKATRSVALVCAAYAASVLDNALDAARLGYEERESAVVRADEVLAEFATWPFGNSTGGGGRRRAQGADGAPLAPKGKESVHALLREVRKEMGESEAGGEAGGDVALHFEVVASVLEVFSRMDSLL